MSFKIMTILEKYKQWCKETKRNGSVLVGGSMFEFFRWLSETYSPLTPDDVKLIIRGQALYNAGEKPNPILSQNVFDEDTHEWETSVVHFEVTAQWGYELSLKELEAKQGHNDMLHEKLQKVLNQNAIDTLEIVRLKKLISDVLGYGYHVAKDEAKGIQSSGYGTRFKEKNNL